MNENQPNTHIDGIKTQVADLINAVFNNGIKLGKHEMYLQNSANKEEFQRVYEEVDKLRSDKAYIEKKFENYLMNTTGGKATNPYADEDELQQCFCETFEAEVEKRVKEKSKANLGETLLTLSDKLNTITKELEEARSRNEQLEARLKEIVSLISGGRVNYAYADLDYLKEKVQENIREKAENLLKHGDPNTTWETWGDWIKANKDKPVPDILLYMLNSKR